MRFLHGKLKAFTGEKITVEISLPTRVLIMPERQFSKYRENMTFTYFGGQKDGSYEFVIPKSGTWVVVVEKGTYGNPLNMEVKISKDAPVKEQVAIEDKKSKKKKKSKKEKIAESEENASLKESNDENLDQTS